LQNRLVVNNREKYTYMDEYYVLCCCMLMLKHPGVESKTLSDRLNILTLRSISSDNILLTKKLSEKGYYCTTPIRILHRNHNLHQKHYLSNCVVYTIINECIHFITSYALSMIWYDIGSARFKQNLSLYSVP